MLPAATPGSLITTPLAGVEDLVLLGARKKILVFFYAPRGVTRGKDRGIFI